MAPFTLVVGEGARFAEPFKIAEQLDGLPFDEASIFVIDKLARVRVGESICFDQRRSQNEPQPNRNDVSQPLASRGSAVE